MQKRYLFQDVIQWIVRQYQEIQQANIPHNHFHIVNPLIKNNESQLTIQIVGKNITFKATAAEIFEHDQLLEGFSKQEVKLITYMACKTKEQPKYNIVLQEFSAKLNRLIFKLQKCDSTDVLFKTAEDISKDPSLINGLSQRDAHKIGYAAAMEQLQQVDETIARLGLEK
ncbi:MAG: hypothetical protein A3F17_06990 [Gammaproteobacteria bacterium RIFCSPHIGHO2_12_FULL_41_15]|nr:MAG: hypothetical protein A3F17_06990 [Gammaproteobacteria bacterium RIFCSPHIGHO2_12_FULL_41_15]